jgi:hypothetical protein
VRYSDISSIALFAEYCLGYLTSLVFPNELYDRFFNLCDECHWDFDGNCIIHVSNCTPMFIAMLFTIAKLWKQPRCPSTDEWIKKVWYLYTVEFYSAMRKNEILSFAGKWMDLENILLSEVSQAQKTKIVCSPSYAHFRSRENAAVLLDLDHMTRGEHIQEIQE